VVVKSSGVPFTGRSSPLGMSVSSTGVKLVGLDLHELFEDGARSLAGPG
jgi:hypothetical protein